MGYSNHYSSGDNEPNSISLAMFASVGFHGVLFVLMAFFPAASETVEKPLRVVNLLPPGDLTALSPQNQAKTSTLEDILQNPLPDLSVGFPPIGNSDGLSTPDAPETSSYFSDNSDYNTRVNTDNLKTVDPPNRSFAPPSSPPSSPSPPSPSPSLPLPSGIQPAPNTPIGASPNPFNQLPQPPNIIGAVPEPGVSPSGVPTFPSPSSPGVDIPASSELRKIPPSQQTFVSILPTSVPYEYPTAACPNELEGTVTLTYSRGADGTLFDSSITFENPAKHSLLNDVAVAAVMNAPAAEGTGFTQRYLTRFDFAYPNNVCAPGSNNPKSPSPQTTPSTPPNIEGSESSPADQDVTSNDPSSPNTPVKTPDASDSETPKPQSDAPKGSESEPPSQPTESSKPTPNPTPIPPQPSEPIQAQPNEPIIPPAGNPAEPENNLPSPAPPEPKSPTGDASDLIPLETNAPPTSSPPTSIPSPEPQTPRLELEDSAE